MGSMTRQAFKIDELRMVWERKCLNGSLEAINARRSKARKRIMIGGQAEPTMDEVERMRAVIEDEAFQLWLTEKQLTGFDRT